MDLSQVILVNYIDRTKIGSDHPLLTVQRVIRYVAEDASEGVDLPDVEEYKSRVVSLTKKHWEMFEVLTDQAGISSYTLFQTAERYVDALSHKFDEKLEICLELIWQMLDLNEDGALEGLSEVDIDFGDVDDAVEVLSDDEMNKTLH